MEKSILVMVLVLAVLPYQLQSYYTSYNWLSIDCGATNTWEDPLTNYWWRLDDEFIKTGQNILLSVTTNRLPLETLRYFPEGTKNCYNLPLEVQEKYLIRAGFYYGNYDNLSKPPTFNLEFDGNLWATVTTSLGTDPIYHEVIYITRKEYVSICITKTQQGQIPFISSLEAICIYDGVYRLMNNDTALYLERRTNYGANQTFPERFDTLAEYYNRFWKPEQLPNYQNPFNGIDSDFSSMRKMFRTPSSCLSIFMRRLHSQPTLLRPYEECVVVSVYPVNVTGTANVTISPAQGTTLPPTLNAMEVFTTIEVSTSKSDPRLSFCAFFYVLVCLSGFVVWFG
ncbi:hypothetical protein AAG906_032643 [Vitis piasezkii]